MELMVFVFKIVVFQRLINCRIKLYVIYWIKAYQNEIVDVFYIINKK